MLTAVITLTLSFSVTAGSESQLGGIFFGGSELVLAPKHGFDSAAEEQAACVIDKLLHLLSLPLCRPSSRLLHQVTSRAMRGTSSADLVLRAASTRGDCNTEFADDELRALSGCCAPPRAKHVVLWHASALCNAALGPAVSAARAFSRSFGRCVLELRNARERPSSQQTGDVFAKDAEISRPCAAVEAALRHPLDSPAYRAIFGAARLLWAARGPSSTDHTTAEWSLAGLVMRKCAPSAAAHASKAGGIALTIAHENCYRVVGRVAAEATRARAASAMKVEEARFRRSSTPVSKRKAESDSRVAALDARWKNYKAKEWVKWRTARAHLYGHPSSPPVPSPRSRGTSASPEPFKRAAQDEKVTEAIAAAPHGWAIGKDNVFEAAQNTVDHFNEAVHAADARLRNQEHKQRRQHVAHPSGEITFIATGPNAPATAPKIQRERARPLAQEQHARVSERLSRMPHAATLAITRTKTSVDAPFSRQQQIALEIRSRPDKVTWDKIMSSHERRKWTQRFERAHPVTVRTSRGNVRRATRAPSPPYVLHKAATMAELIAGEEHRRAQIAKQWYKTHPTRSTTATPTTSTSTTPFSYHPWYRKSRMPVQVHSENVGGYTRPCPTLPNPHLCSAHNCVWDDVEGCHPTRATASPTPSHLGSMARRRRMSLAAKKAAIEFDAEVQKQLAAERKVDPFEMREKAEAKKFAAELHTREVHENDEWHALRSQDARHSASIARHGRLVHDFIKAHVLHPEVSPTKHALKDAKDILSAFKTLMGNVTGATPAPTPPPSPPPTLPVLPRRFPLPTPMSPLTMADDDFMALHATNEKKHHITSLRIKVTHEPNRNIPTRMPTPSTLPLDMADDDFLPTVPYKSKTSSQNKHTGRAKDNAQQHLASLPLGAGSADDDDFIASQPKGHREPNAISKHVKKKEKEAEDDQEKDSFRHFIHLLQKKN